MDERFHCWGTFFFFHHESFARRLKGWIVAGSEWNKPNYVRYATYKETRDARNPSDPRINLPCFLFTDFGRLPLAVLDVKEDERDELGIAASIESDPDRRSRELLGRSQWRAMLTRGRPSAHLRTRLQRMGNWGCATKPALHAQEVQPVTVGHLLLSSKERKKSHLLRRWPLEVILIGYLAQFRILFLFFVLREWHVSSSQIHLCDAWTRYVKCLIAS